MTWPLKQKWFWMLFFLLLGMVLGAFVIVGLIFYLSPNLIVIALIVVLILLVVVRSYRRWVASKPEEEYGRQEQQGGREQFLEFPIKCFD